jgi:hypothetical protein
MDIDPADPALHHGLQGLPEQRCAPLVPAGKIDKGLA